MDDYVLFVIELDYAIRRDTFFIDAKRQIIDGGGGGEFMISCSALSISFQIYCFYRFEHEFLNIYPSDY